MDRKELTSRPNRIAVSTATPSYNGETNHFLKKLLQQRNGKFHRTSLFWQSLCRVVGNVKAESKVLKLSWTLPCWNRRVVFCGISVFGAVRDASSLLDAVSSPIGWSSVKDSACLTLVAAPEPSCEKGLTTCFSSQSICTIRWPAIVCWQELVELVNGMES